MECSLENDKVSAALVLAQTAMPAVHKSADNPFFHSKYAPLDAVMDAALKACNAHGLAVIQAVSDGNREGFTLHTTLIHTSGQWISGGLWFPCPEEVRKLKDGTVTGYGPPTPQGVGASVSYARRYSLSAMLGIVGEDDLDGEDAMGRAGKGNLAPLVKEKLERIPAPKIETSKGSGTVNGVPKSCPKCGGKVWDNREKKASGEYKETSPDWSCADKECKIGKFRTAGWIEDKPDPLEKIPSGGPGDPKNAGLYDGLDQEPEAFQRENDLPF